jgi:hypothetical protein
MKRALDRGITLLIITNLLVVAGLLVAVLVGRINAEPPGHPAQELPSPTGDIALMSMGPAHIPTSSSCLLCHETGGEAGLKPIPAIGHPLEGWRECAACHTGERLGQTAPGHDGIPPEECLNCHVEAQPGPAITQPHSELQDQNCLDCHGDYIHLPDSHVGRKQTECWLCHKPQELPPPRFPHAHDTRLTCRNCHQSEQVGELPMDHALRDDTTCLLCHEILRASPPPNAPATPEVTPPPAEG